MSPQRALTTFVGMVLREYKISLESLEGSGWTVSKISKIEIYTIPAARVYSVGAAGTWIPTPRDLADKHCSINVKSPRERCSLLSKGSGGLGKAPREPEP